jgi:hypothetical protein
VSARSPVSTFVSILFLPSYSPVRADYRGEHLVSTVYCQQSFADWRWNAVSSKGSSNLVVTAQWTTQS